MPFDQFQGVHRIRVQRGNHVDGKEHALSVWAQAELLCIPLGVTNPVQNVIGLLNVMVGELARQLFVVPRVAGAWAGLVGFGLTKINQVNDFLAVDAQRQRLTELLVGNHLAHFGVFVRHVQVDLNLLCAGGNQLNQPITALLLVLRQRWLVLE